VINYVSCRLKIERQHRKKGSFTKPENQSLRTSFPKAQNHNETWKASSFFFLDSSQLSQLPRTFFPGNRFLERKREPKIETQLKATSALIESNTTEMHKTERCIDWSYYCFKAKLLSLYKFQNLEIRVKFQRKGNKIKTEKKRKPTLETKLESCQKKKKKKKRKGQRSSQIEDRGLLEKEHAFEIE